MKSLLPLLQAIGHDKLNLDISNINTPLINFITDSGMAAYFNYCTQNSANSLPETDKNKIYSATLTAKIITNTLLNSLKEILDSSDQCHSDIILLKGISHAQCLYPSPWFRIMSDIDLLVSEIDLEIMKNILFELGFIQTSINPQKFYDSHHHIMPFHNKKNNVWIEIHTHLFSTTTDVRKDSLFNINEIGKNSCDIKNTPYHKNVKKLCPELHLIYTCVHWAEDYNLYKTGLQFTDIILLIKRENIDWIKTVNWLSNTTSASYVYLALSYLEQSDAIEIPTDFFKSCNLKHKNMGYLNKYILFKIIDNYFLGKKRYNNFFNENNLKIIWSTLLKPSPSLHNLFFLPINIVFPPANADRFKLHFITNRILSLFVK